MRGAHGDWLQISGSLGPLAHIKSSSVTPSSSQTSAFPSLSNFSYHTNQLSGALTNTSATITHALLHKHRRSDEKCIRVKTCNNLISYVASEINILQIIKFFQSSVIILIVGVCILFFVRAILTFVAYQGDNRLNIRFLVGLLDHAKPIL